MPPKRNAKQPQFWISLGCEEEDDPPLLQDLYEFMHDFNLVYEVSRAATDPNYDFPLPELVGFGGDHGLYAHLRNEDRLYVERIRHESPLELVTVAVATSAGVGAIWGLVQTLEKIVNFRLNRKKLKEEVKKLERENSQSPSGTARPSDSTFLFENRRFFEDRLEERGAMSIYRDASERLLASKFQITRVSIELKGIGRHTSPDTIVEGPNGGEIPEYPKSEKKSRPRNMA